jgi:hypothetical protein
VDADGAVDLDSDLNNENIDKYVVLDHLFYPRNTSHKKQFKYDSHGRESLTIREMKKVSKLVFDTCT